MGTTIHEVWIVSNVEQKLARMTASMEAYSASTNKAAASTQTATATTQYRAGATNVLTARQMALNRATSSLNRKISKNIALSRLFGSAQHTAGLNVGMLSLRIAEGLVPVLALAYTAMLPVIAGLLAIASAAIAATLGLGGLMAIGLYKWSKEFSGENMGYSGARRPYSSNTRNDDFWSHVFEPFAKSLDDPAIKSKIDSAVAWTKEVFQKDLPNAFSNFVQTLAAGDFTAIRNIMSMFREWLPEASTGLARWGQQFLNLIGAQSLSRMNAFFKYLAGGLMSIAEYLNNGGFEDFDSFFSIIGRFISKLMELGKSVLPLIVYQLEQIYPNPLEPVIDKLIEFFTAIRNNQGALSGFGNIAQLVTVSVILSYAIKLIAAIALGIKYLFYGVLLLGLASIISIADAALFRLTYFVGALIDTIYTGFVNLYRKLKSIFTGGEYVPLEYADPMAAFDTSDNELFSRLNMPSPFKGMFNRRLNIEDDINRLGGIYEGTGNAIDSGAVAVRVFIDEDWNLAAEVENETNSTIGTSRRSGHTGRANWG